MNDEDLHNKARISADTFMQVLRDRHGLSDQEILHLADDLILYHKRIVFARRMGEWTAQATISLALAAFFGGVGWALYHFIEHVSKR